MCDKRDSDLHDLCCSPTPTENALILSKQCLGSKFIWKIAILFIAGTSIQWTVLATPIVSAGG